jgi:hypothetical protein
MVDEGEEAETAPAFLEAGLPARVGLPAAAGIVLTGFFGYL